MSRNLFERNYAYDSYEIIAETDELDRVLGVYTHSAMRTDDVLSQLILKSDGVGVSSSEFRKLLLS
jgi:hypothetical protein